MISMHRKFDFKQLTAETRRIMKEEFLMDKTHNNLYISPRLTIQGLAKFPFLLLQAIENGDEQSLSKNLKPFFNLTEPRKTRSGSTVAKIPYNAPNVLGEGQFNFYYIRAICAQALQQRKSSVQIYRARHSDNPRKSSNRRISKKISAKQLLDDLRINDFVNNKFRLPEPNSGLSVFF